ncbi:MAG: hypothetical protein ACXAE3_16685 [Candidatus Kariarchaeaceae archaeon]|jgi:hypothetical protein
MQILRFLTIAAIISGIYGIGFVFINPLIGLGIIGASFLIAQSSNTVYVQLTTLNQKIERLEKTITDSS